MRKLYIVTIKKVQRVLKVYLRQIFEEEYIDMVKRKCSVPQPKIATLYTIDNTTKIMNTHYLISHPAPKKSRSTGAAKQFKQKLQKNYMTVSNRVNSLPTVTEPPAAVVKVQWPPSIYIPGAEKIVPVQIFNYGYCRERIYRYFKSNDRNYEKTWGLYRTFEISYTIAGMLCHQYYTTNAD